MRTQINEWIPAYPEILYSARLARNRQVHRTGREGGGAATLFVFTATIFIAALEWRLEKATGNAAFLHGG
jgi:hypothetical protein